MWPSRQAVPVPRQRSCLSPVPQPSSKLKSAGLHAYCSRHNTRSNLSRTLLSLYCLAASKMLL